MPVKRAHHPAGGRAIVVKQPPSEDVITPDLWVDGDTVIILSGCMWRSCGGGQRPVALARAWARRGLRVLYCNPCEQGAQWAGGPLVVNPDSLRRLEPLLFADRPGLVYCGLQAYWEIAQRYQAHGWHVAYDIMDDWRAFQRVGEAHYYREEVERELLDQADILTCSAPALQAYPHNGREPHLVWNAGPSEPVRTCARPDDLVVGEQGTALYLGYLVGDWFDWELFGRTARDLPGVAFNIVGDNKGRWLKLPNVHFLGERPYPVAMQYVAHCDVGLIPFRHAKLCAAVDPIKLYDYVAGGCRVGASGVLTALAGREWCTLAPKGARTLAPQIEEAIAAGRIKRAAARKWLRANSWHARAGQFCDLWDTYREVMDR